MAVAPVITDPGPVTLLTAALVVALFLLIVILRPLYDLWMGY